MSILAQQLKNPKIKPKWWGSLGLVESVVRYNCMKRGFPVPVLALPVWEGAGNKVYDVSGKRNHGTLTNGAKWLGGQFGNAILFDGVNDNINCGTKESLNVINKITIEARIKGTNSWNATCNGIVHKDRLYALRVMNGILKVYIGDSVNWTGPWGTQSLSLNIWYHVMITYNRSLGSNNLKFYIDGSYKEGFDVTTDMGSGNTNNTFVGSSALGGYPFNGLIDEADIYNSALSASQVKFLYDNPYFMFEMPEELWGYVVAAPTITHPGWLWNKAGWF